MEINTTNLKSIIHKIISQCFECSERKTPGGKHSPNLSYAATYPFETIALDITGPLQKTRTNNLYLLSIIDVFSRWIVLVTLKGIKLQQIKLDSFVRQTEDFDI